jgi:putative transposase
MTRSMLELSHSGTLLEHEVESRIRRKANVRFGRGVTWYPIWKRRSLPHEVFLTINGKRHYLWRAVDQDDNVLDILVQSRRNKKAAKKFFRKLLKGLQYVPRVVITDKLKSYGAAKREILPGVEHRQSRYLNNRCEFSHRPTRQRERRMQGFKSAGHAQRFLSAFGPIFQHFRPRRHLLSASEYRDEMRNRFESWAEITGTQGTV